MVDLAKKSFPWMRVSFIGAALVFAIAALAMGGARLYRKWEPPHLASQARRFLEKKDYASAILAARRGIAINPANLECCEVLAQIADALGTPEAVSLRQRALSLRPQSTDCALNLAETASHFGEWAVAGKALEGVRQSDRENVRYQSDLGVVAAALSHFDMAIEAYGKAVQMDPASSNLSLQFSSVQLRRGRSDDRLDARARLNEVGKNPQFRVSALRLLLKDDAAHGEINEALSHGRLLAAENGSTFDDKVLVYDLLESINATDAPLFFDSLKTTAVNDCHAMATLIASMDRWGKAADAIKWGHSFPSKLNSCAEVSASLALCFLSLKDWAGLDSYAVQGNWQGLNFLRLAFAARAERELGRYEESRSQWESAVALALPQTPRTMDLVRVATEWGWDHEAQDLLSQTVAPSQEAKAALATLYHRFAIHRDTKGLWQASGKMSKFSPEDDQIKNNFVMYSLLLNRDVSVACALAKNLFKRHSSDPAFVSTYAYSLLVAGEPKAALQAMRTMNATESEIPEMAGYHAMILSANWQNEEALKFFDLAKNGRFLPEEETLINDRKRRTVAQLLLPTIFIFCKKIFDGMFSGDYKNR